MPTSLDLLEAAAKHQRDRAATYDAASGERSMQRAVTAFNALTGSTMTEREGWMFMLALKASRFYQNPSKPHRDSVEDLIAYASLWGESALDVSVATDDEWIEWKGVGERSVSADTRILVKFRNGNICSGSGGMFSWSHLGNGDDIIAYRVITVPAPAENDGWIEWKGGERPVPVGTRVEYQMRDNDYGRKIKGAENLRWSHEDEFSDIVAYRIIK